MTTPPLRPLLSLAVLLMLAAPSRAPAATINVSSAKYSTIQAGIDAAQSGDTVLVADGTYTGNGNRDLDFHGKSLTVKSLHGAAKTILDCGGSAAKPHRGFFIHRDELAVTIDGFTVEHGNTTHEAVPQSGAGDWSSRLGGGGGGIYINTQGSAVVKNCVCRNNTSNSDYGGGGGVYINSGGVVVANCTFSGNTVNGGAVTGSEASFMGITHGGYGGGAFVENIGGLEMRNCTFSGNTANGGNSTTNGSVGGGIFISNRGRVTVTGCTFHGNTASGHFASGGGAHIRSGSGSSVTNCAFSGNSANGTNQSGEGGGIYMDCSNKGEPAVMMNCTFSGNTTNSITLANDTSGALYGGKGCAAYLRTLNGTAVTNCIAWGNKSTSNSALATEFSYQPQTVVFTYDDFQGGVPDASTHGNMPSGTPSTGSLNADPLFVNAAAGDLRLKPGSPCLGAGTPKGAPATDLAGKPRLNPPSMGAYETSPIRP